MFTNLANKNWGTNGYTRPVGRRLLFMKKQGGSIQNPLSCNDILVGKDVGVPR